MSKSILGLLFAMFFAFPSRAEQPIFNITSLDANPGEIIEINFNVDNFTDLLSVQFSINFDPAVLDFRALKNINPSVPGLNANSFNVVDFIDEGKITLAWFESALNQVTIPDGSLFFTIEFEVIGVPCDNSIIAITDDPLDIEVSEDGNVDIGLVSNNGLVTVPGTGCIQDINLIGNSIVAACGSEACIEFTVENFTTVGLMEFSLAFDPTVLQFNRFQNYAPLPTFGNGSTNQFPTGNLRVIWTHPNAENSSLPDGTTLFEICFDVIGAGGQSSTITFGNNPPTLIADIDENAHEVNIQPAVITAQCALEGFALIAEASVCTQPNGLACIDISVNDFEEMLVLQFSMNWDSTRFIFDHLEGFNLSGLDTNSFGQPPQPQVRQGQLTVSWFDPNLQGITLPDMTSIFTVCLRAIGPVGSSSAFTFSGIPLDIEFANVDSTLTTYGLLPGIAVIQQNCDSVPCNISYTLNVTHPGCPGQSNGALDLTLNTGSCPGTPTYLWSNSFTTQDISGVPAGAYTVTITLGTQIVVATDTVVNPPAIGVSGTITHPIPAGTPTGAINITVTGGTPPYSFQWNTNPVITTEDLNNLLAGTYVVTVTDSRGCTFVPDPFIVGADVVGLVTDASCPGTCNGSITASASFGSAPYTFFWNTQTTATINNLCPGTYCVTITDSGGSTRTACYTVMLFSQPPLVTASITHDINENGQGAIDLNVTGGTNPIFYNWSPDGQNTQDIINLSQGQYCVTITFGLSCTYDTCFTIFAGGIGLILDVTQYGNFQTSCNNICDGEIFSSVSGGVPPLSYLWSNNATTADLTNLCPGIYSLTVTDATGNTSSSSTTIVAPPALTFTTIKTDPTDITLSNGAISIIANGGVPPYTYDWIAGNVSSKNNLPHGTYSITVIDQNGCEFTGFVQLEVDGVPCYSASTIITPNSDGKNDFFFIACIFDADNHLYIFNRHGGLVYDVQNYTNNWTGVDGDNQPIADGGYMWVLEVENPDGTTRILKGTVNVLRTAD